MAILSARLILIECKRCENVGLYGIFFFLPELERAKSINLPHNIFRSEIINGANFIFFRYALAEARISTLYYLLCAIRMVQNYLLSNREIWGCDQRKECRYIRLILQFRWRLMDFYLFQRASTRSTFYTCLIIYEIYRFA